MNPSSNLDTEDLSKTLEEPAVSESSLETTELAPLVTNDPNQTADLTSDVFLMTPLLASNQTTDLTFIKKKLPLKGFPHQKVVPFLRYRWNEQEEKYLLNRSEMTIGRIPKNDLCLEGKNISRTHCKISRIRHYWYLEDCGSFNGTYVAGQKLTPHEKYRLAPNTLFALGEYPIEFCYPVPSSFEPVSLFSLFRFIPGFLFSISIHLFVLYLFAHIIFALYEKTSPPLKVTSLKESLSEKESEEIFQDSKMFETKQIQEDVQEFPTPVVEDPSPLLEELPFEETEEVSEIYREIQDSPKTELDFSLQSKDILGVGGLPKGAFSGRFGGKKSKLLRRYGGGAETEKAVEAGLKWLSKHQSPEGYWDGGEFTKQCEGTPCTDKRAAGVNREAITAFCLLAFLGAGHTENQGRYHKTVQKAIHYLRQQQNADGSYGRGNNLYTHAMATLALTEASQFEQKNRRRKNQYVLRGLDYLIRSQKTGEGWRYNPKDPSDTSVTGWCVMALKSGKDAGFPIPASAFEDSLAWFNKVTNNYYLVGYLDARSVSIPMTAVGVASRFFLGQSNKEPAISSGVNEILKLLPEEASGKMLYNRDYYYWYYGTLATFQYGGEPWKQWNEALKKALLPGQKKEGCETGSWGTYCRWFGAAGGRPLNTAVSILMLEIYYRYPQVFR